MNTGTDVEDPVTTTTSTREGGRGSCASSLEESVDGDIRQGLQNLHDDLSKREKLPETFITKKANVFHVWAFGIVLVSGGIVYPYGFQAGVGTFALSTLFSGLAYLCLTLCMAEMTSAMPFAGGAYGYARVALGPFMGFLVGCFECMEYILFAAAQPPVVANLIVSLANADKSLVPVLIVIGLLVPFTSLMLGGKHIWTSFLTIGTIFSLIIILYVLGTSTSMDFTKNARYDDDSLSNPYFVGGIQMFLKTVPLACGFFCGIEGTPLMSEEVVQPKKTIWKGMVASIVTLNVVALLVVVCCSSNPPGIAGVVNDPFSLRYGFNILFNSNSPWIDIIPALPVLGITYATMYAFSRQMYAMGRSGLLPRKFTYTSSKGVPQVALIFGSLLAFLAAMVEWSQSSTTNVQSVIYGLGLFMGYWVYIAQLLSFFVLRAYYPSIPRGLVNPAPILTVAYGLTGFLLLIIVTLVYDPFQTNGYTWMLTIAYAAACSLYYFFISSKTQYFSPEEKDVLFIAYILRAHMKKAEARRRASLTLKMKLKNKVTAADLQGVPLNPGL